MEKTMPLAHLITFTCYGTSLFVEDPPTGSSFSTPQIRRAPQRTHLSEPSYPLDELRRYIVLHAIEEVCDFYGWDLYAAHVRTHHVHLVVWAPDDPQKTMHLIKVNAARRLRESKLDKNRINRWAQAGCIQCLRTHTQILAAIRYVVEEQGLPMAVSEPLLKGGYHVST